MKTIYAFADLLSTIDECDDLEVECSSQESSDNEGSFADEQETVQVPPVLDQSIRVKRLAAFFKKTFSEPLPKTKPVTSNTVG